MIRDRDGHPEGKRKEKSGEAHFPHHSYRPINQVGKNCPSPGRSASSRFSAYAASDQVNCPAGESGEHAIEGENGPGGGGGVNSEDFKYSAENIGIDGRRPGAGARRE